MNFELFFLFLGVVARFIAVMCTYTLLKSRKGKEGNPISKFVFDKLGLETGCLVLCLVGVGILLWAYFQGTWLIYAASIAFTLDALWDYKLYLELGSKYSFFAGRSTKTFALGIEVIKARYINENERDVEDMWITCFFLFWFVSLRIILKDLTVGLRLVK